MCFPFHFSTRTLPRSDTNCVICFQNLEPEDAVVLTKKGSEKINIASRDRGEELFTEPMQKVHEKCRCEFIHSHYIDKETVKRKSEHLLYCEATPSKLRSNYSFNFCDDCLFCGQQVVRKGSRIKWYPVRTLEFQNTLLKVCETRNDDWGRTVKGRIASVSDLHAADAVYHHVCSTNFRTSKAMPKKFSTDKSTCEQNESGRPATQQSEFDDVISFLNDSYEKQVTVNDLVIRMQSLCGEKAFTTKWMKQRLQEHYGDRIVMSDKQGRKDVITFKETASDMLHNFYLSAVNNEQEEKRKIIKSAAEIIRNDICALELDKDIYPAAADISQLQKNLEIVPESLQFFLRTVAQEKLPNLKTASIGQAIVQETRQRALICPLQLGLGVQMHRLYGSLFLIDSLYSLGFCSSYSEIQKFEACAAVEGSSEKQTIGVNDCLQFVADNVDHNTDTLDGKQTFHGMGMISCLTPKATGFFGRKILRKDVSAEDISNLGKVNISYFKPCSQNAMAKLRFSELQDLRSPASGLLKVDLIVKAVWSLRSPIPSWAGTMQAISKGEFTGQSSIQFLPIIDMNPSDLSCVYSTLKYINSEARKYGKVPIVTFDQPLYWKSIMIASNTELKDMVIRLGPFHTEMSFLGSIGHIMAGSGLKELLELVYASNSVIHMMNGKAVSRAVRGYMLIDMSLSVLLLEKMQSNYQGPEESLQAAVLATYDSLMQGRLEEDDLKVGVAQFLEDEMNRTKLTLCKSRTATLWITFMEMMSVLRKFLIAERTGNWLLHLESIQDMLPYFAAAGHNLYAKSAYIYLNQMQALRTKSS